MRQTALIELAFIKVVVLNKDVSKATLFLNFRTNKRVLSFDNCQIIVFPFSEHF